VVLASLIVGYLGNWFDALQAQAILGLTWQQLAFFLFGLAVIIALIEQEIRYRKLEKARPRISVKANVTDNNHAVLLVTNDGFGGDFSAKVRLIEPTQTNDIFDLPWESSGKTRYHIDGGGGEATLLVALKITQHYASKDEKTSITSYRHTGSLSLVNVRNESQLAYSLFGWDNDATKPQSNYECILEVTITSEPTLLKPFKNHLYSLKCDGIGLYFTPLLVADKSKS